MPPPNLPSPAVDLLDVFMFAICMFIWCGTWNCLVSMDSENSWIQRMQACRFEESAAKSCPLEFLQRFQTHPKPKKTVRFFVLAKTARSWAKTKKNSKSPSLPSTVLPHPVAPAMSSWILVWLICHGLPPRFTPEIYPRNLLDSCRIGYIEICDKSSDRLC